MKGMKEQDRGGDEGVDEATGRNQRFAISEIAKYKKMHKRT